MSKFCPLANGTRSEGPAGQRRLWFAHDAANPPRLEGDYDKRFPERFICNKITLVARSSLQAQCIAPGAKPNIDYRRTSLQHGTMIKIALVLRVPWFFARPVHFGFARPVQKSLFAVHGRTLRPPLPLGEP